MGLFKRLLKRSVREANTYTLMAESHWLKNDFIGEKKNMKFDFHRFQTDHCLMYISSETEFYDFVSTLKIEASRIAGKYIPVWWAFERFPGYYFYEPQYKPTLSSILVYRTNDIHRERQRIFKWSDFMKDKKFTKSDLKNGDVVMRRNGNVEIVCLETDTLIRQSGYNPLSSIDEDLTVTQDSRASHSWDIVAVRRPRGSKDCGFHAFRDNCGELIYDRERDDPEIEEMTMEDVCKALGKRVKIVDRK